MRLRIDERSAAVRDASLRTFACLFTPRRDEDFASAQRIEGCAHDEQPPLCALAQPPERYLLTHPQCAGRPTQST